VGCGCVCKNEYKKKEVEKMVRAYSIKEWFRKVYGKTPTEEELSVFEDYIRLIKEN